MFVNNLACLFFISINSVVSTKVTMYNSFEDSSITGGSEIIYDATEATALVEGTDLFLFPTPGFYDIDVDMGSLTMTLQNNSAASDLILPEGRFDRYYATFDNIGITSVALEGADELNRNAAVELLPHGYVLNLTDPFMTGIAMPVLLPNGGLKIELRPGTDLTELQQSLRLTYTFSEDSVIAANTFFDQQITGGAETIYDLRGPVNIVDGPEMLLFPGGSFFDLDFKSDEMTMTLRDNADASALVFPADRYDRYYFGFSFDVPHVQLASSGGLMEFVTVSKIEPGFSLDTSDVFMTGIPLPITFPNGGVKVEVGPGSNYTELGRQIKVLFSEATFAPTDAPTDAPTSAGDKNHIIVPFMLSMAFVAIVVGV